MIRHIFTIFFSFILVICLNSESASMTAKCREGDCLNGTGTMVLPSGSRYIGEFKNGLFNGRGTMYFYNGSKYEGTWKDGAMEGEGTWYYSNGLSMKSTFSSDRASGEVTMSKKIIERPADRLASLVPSGTEALIVLHSMDTFFKYFPLNTENFGGKPMKKSVKKEIVHNLGFNPLDRAELLAAGFDPGREAGIAVSDMKSKGNQISVNFVFCMPVLDGEKALKSVKQALRKLTRNRITFMRQDKTLKAVVRNKKMPMLLARKGKYLMLSFNPGGDSLPYIQKILEGKSSLKNDIMYKEVAGRINTNEEIFLYMDGKNIFEFYYMMIAHTLGYRGGQQLAMLKAMNNVSREMTKDYRGLGLTFDCNTKDLIVKSVFNVNSGASILKLYGKVVWDREPLMGHPANPLFLMSLGINMQEYYAFLSRSMSPFIYGMIETRLSQFTTKYKVDIRKEIIDNMAGTINAGVYDGSTLKKDFTNLFFTFNVKDRDLLDGVIKKLTSSLPAHTIEKIETSPYGIYKINMDGTYIYLSVKKKTCVIALSPEMLKKVNKASWSRSFLKKMPDRKLASGLRSNQSIIYLDGPELRKAVKNFMNSDSSGYRAVDSILSWYRYLYIYYGIKDDSVYSSMEVRTYFKAPFFNGLADSIVNIKK